MFQFLPNLIPSLQNYFYPFQSFLFHNSLSQILNSLSPVNFNHIFKRIYIKLVILDENSIVFIFKELIPLSFFFFFF